MSATNYEVVLGAARPGGLRRFLTSLTDWLDSLVANRSCNALLDRDLQQARHDMERIARLLDAGAPSADAGRIKALAGGQRRQRASSG